MGLTKKKRAFVEIYCSRPDFNPTEAAKQAGFAYGRAKQTAYELLHRDADVMREVQRRLPPSNRPDKIAERVDAIAAAATTGKVTVERVIQDLEAIEEMCRSAGPGAWQAATLVKVVELKGKYLKMWSDKIEIGADDKFMELLLAGRQRAFQSPPPLLDAQVIKTNGDDIN